MPSDSSASAPPAVKKSCRYVSRHRNRCGASTCRSCRRAAWDFRRAILLGQQRTSLIGGPAAPVDALVPTAIVTPHRFFDLALTETGTACGIRNSGQVVCWGRAARDALGRPGVTLDDPEPKPVVSDNIFVSIERNGSGFTTASIDRELVVWGALPNATSAEGLGYSTPTRVPFDERFIGVLGGGTRGYACMKSLFGGARCIDLRVLASAAVRQAVPASHPAQFGVPLR